VTFEVQRVKIGLAPTRQERRKAFRASVRPNIMQCVKRNRYSGQAVGLLNSRGERVVIADGLEPASAVDVDNGRDSCFAPMPYAADTVFTGRDRSTTGADRIHDMST
jgi:hypothetical protein